MNTSSPTDIVLQKQPTPVTCVQTCLAMALGAPVEQVIERYGQAAMGHKQLISALTECRFAFNQVIYGTLITSGWYFVTVPSLNNPGGSHKVLMHADIGGAGFTILDPSTRNTYKPDGTNLYHWSDPVLFILGGTLPGENFRPENRDIASPAPPPPADEFSEDMPPNVGVGMPEGLFLDEFGSQVMSLFGYPPYLVGSALVSKRWRDVDVRLILPDEEYDAWGFGDPDYQHTVARWVSLCMAYSELGKKITGLPIDFQIQQQTNANKKYNGPRSALGLVPRRLGQPPPPPNSPRFPEK